MKKIDFKEIGRQTLIVLFCVAVVSLGIFFGPAFKPDNATPVPAVPVEENSSITRINGNMGYEVNAYKIHTDGLDFLVIVQANKGGVAVTRIK